MDVSNLINEKTIFVNLNVSSREECLNALIDSMDKCGKIADKAKYFEAVMEREKKGSTAVGFGVAIPHGKSSGVAAPALAFALLQNPVEWNSLDGKPVKIVFLIGVSDKDTQNEHLKILVAISKKLIHEDFRKKLLEAKEPHDIIQILESI